MPVKLLEFKNLLVDGNIEIVDENGTGGVGRRRNLCLQFLENGEIAKFRWNGSCQLVAGEVSRVKFCCFQDLFQTTGKRKQRELQ